MADEQKKESKRRQIEPGLFQNSDNTYDVRVSRRIKIKKDEPSKQFFKHARSVIGLGNAMKVRRELLDDLASPQSVQSFVADKAISQSLGEQWCL